MKNIEKSLTNYAQGRGPMISNKELLFCASKNADEIINILFKLINDELNFVTGTKSLNRIRELVHCIEIVLENSDQLNRKIVSRRLHRLDERIDRLKRENKKQFIDITNAFKELELTRKELDKVAEKNEEKETKQYDFINYLIDAIKNISYIEYTFHKMPFLVNVKDKEKSSLFQNIIMKYIDSAESDDEEDVLYYSNLIALILSEKNFEIGEIEKRKCLDIIYTAINKLSIGKKNKKQNRSKIEWLNNLAETIKGEREKEAKIDTIANKYNISIFFKEDILEQARLVKIPKEGEMSDRKIVEDYIITIDKSNAIEIDDALSCRILPNGNYLLGVHIASILGYFPYESNIVEEALGRNHSIYLPNIYQMKENDFNSIVPIFPYDFSAKTGSLIAGVPKLARSYYFEIDKEGNIVREQFFKTIIQSNKKTSYEEIDNILEHGSDNEALQKTIENLQKIAEIIDKRYKGNEIYEQIKENTDDFSDLKVRKKGAENIVYQCMLLTGNRVAEYFADKSRGYPCLYRVHEVNETNSKNLQALVNNLTKTYGGEQYKRLYQLIEGIYPKGWYATSGSHAGLGLDHYCHCTSGLRRSADIVVEHALEVCYDNTPTDKELAKLEEEIEKRAAQINAKQSPIEWFIRDYKRTYQKRR